VISVRSVDAAVCGMAVASRGGDGLAKGSKIR